MATIFQRIFLLYNILYSFILSFLPKKLKINLQDNKSPLQPLPPLPPPPPSSSSLRRVFQMFDQDEDGRITKKELNDSLENLGIFIPNKELTEMIEKFDKNGDGCVDLEEFKGLYESLVTEGSDGDEDLKEAFDVFDRNGDGFISVDELRTILISFGEKQRRINDEDCKKMIMKVDADGDGMVNYEEFKQMMKGNGLCAFA